MPPSSNPVLFRTIADHGMIGNLDTAALIALDGTISFLCWPHLDSSTIFVGLLDPNTGGAFEIEPELADPRRVQSYLPDTNVLLTRWMAEEGSVELLDCMPQPESGARLQNCLIRRITVTRGRVTIRTCCRPMFDYARVSAMVSSCEGGVRFSSASRLDLQLLASVPLTSGDGFAQAEFILEADESAWFLLRDSQEDVPPEDQITQSIEADLAAWRRWSDACTYRGRWREQVNRSALALKLLTSHEHGSIAAAATFGLPEATGAGRNWDYRATWIRDASFTVYAFMRLGYVDEAERFREWVSSRIMSLGEGESLRIMYALDGREAADEETLDHLSGYGQARPVRIGNAAHRQTQLDIYGELLDGLYLSNKYGAAISHEGWAQLRGIVDQVCVQWKVADEGIWEIRDQPREFLHSRMMCWVAIDRALRLARKRSLPAPIVEWAKQRDLISNDIWANFRHPDHGYFVQYKGARDLDASLLMMPLVRFVSATDPVWLSTLDAIGEQLSDDGMVYRYRNADGFEGGEGAFTPCTFWYIECLARAGRLEAAQDAMAKALGYANHVGLFSEELDRRGQPLGNFPQALTHLAFISAAFFLDRRLSHPVGAIWQP